MNNNFGAILKSSREANGLSIRDLAKLANVNDTDISRLENNKILKPSIKVLLSISKVLQVNLLAAYLEDEEKYLYYKKVIDSCTNLNSDQLQDILNYINKLNDRSGL